MSSPFVAEVRMFGCNFAPTGWAQCNGQLLPISQNTALFSLLGTFYGGDGKSTFALPNLQDSTPVGVGQGAGLSEYFLGQQGGAPSITLLHSEKPAHNHFLQAYSGDPADNRIPGPTMSLGTPAPGNFYLAANTPLANMATQALSIAGGSLPHNTLMPSLAVNFCIAMQGVFPSRP
jgi:microcystin-dependent protein